LEEKKTISTLRQIVLFSSCFLLGVLFFITLFGVKNINPLDTSWVKYGGGDNFQHYIGWRFFREFPWTRYFLFMRNLNYPVGSSVIITDSNPLFCTFFKLFRNVLPPEFQFNGIWLTLCFGLQGLFSALIAFKMTGSPFFSVLFSAFAILNPVILQRAAIHDTLAAHWLILFAIFNAINWNKKWNSIAWILNIILVMMIHIYFLPMIGLFFLLQIIRMIQKKIKWWKIIETCLFVILTIFVCYFLLGYQYIQPETTSFGDLSMNLNAFINPDGNSSLLSDRPTFPLQYEGFNYWGLGLICLFLLSLLFLSGKIIKNSWIYFVVCIIYLLIPLSNHITWDNHVLLSFPLPENILSKLSIFRSSGRLSWPFYYLALLTSFVLFSRYAKKNKKFRPIFTVIITLCFVVQIIDFSDFILSYQNRFHQIADREVTTQLSQDQWNDIFGNVEHLAITEGDSKIIDAFALMAIENKITFNRSANARGIKNIFGGENIPISELILTKKFEAKTIYILLDQETISVAEKILPEDISELDGIKYFIFP
jgi:hypothetical protein